MGASRGAARRLDRRPDRWKRVVPQHRGVGLRARARCQLRVRDELAPLRLRVSCDTIIDVRSRCGVRASDTLETAGGSRGLHPCRLHDPAGVGPCPGRRTHSHLGCTSERRSDRRNGTPRCLRVRRIRDLDADTVLHTQAEPARPWRRLCDRSRTGRWRDGEVVVRAGQARQQDEHIHRSDRRDPAPHRCRLRRRRKGGHTRWKRRWAHRWSSCQPRSRALQRRCRRGPLRRRREHDARRVIATHRR